MLNVNGETKVFAILGNPIQHTLSPVMYNTAFSALKINGIYVTMEVAKEQLADAVKGLRALGIQGGNVTLPFKREISAYLDGITEEARLIGAVNTFYWKKDKLWGHNTDGAGFIRALQKVKPEVLHDKGVLILGAGGAARAVAVALTLAGMKNFTIVNRNKKRGKELSALLAKLGAIVSVRDWKSEGLQEVFRENRLLINTTPLGMPPHEKEYPPFNEKWLSKEMFVVDLIYKPRETLLLRKAKARGCETLNGLPMLLEQGILSFERWAGHSAPVEVMRSVLERWV
jgi:shikimate dehydrogenase